MFKPGLTSQRQDGRLVLREPLVNVVLGLVGDDVSGGQVGQGVVPVSPLLPKRSLAPPPLGRCGCRARCPVGQRAGPHHDWRGVGAQEHRRWRHPSRGQPRGRDRRRCRRGRAKHGRAASAEAGVWVFLACGLPGGALLLLLAGWRLPRAGHYVGRGGHWRWGVLPSRGGRWSGFVTSLNGLEGALLHLVATRWSWRRFRGSWLFGAPWRILLISSHAN